MLRSESLHCFTLLAIDPGLNNIGLAIYRVQVHPLKILSISALTLRADRVIDTSGLSDEDFLERTHKRYSMNQAFRHILKNTDPSLVVSESPFFDRRKPSSFAVLTEVLVTLFDTVTAFNPTIRFSVVEPQLVKKVLGVAGQKGKDVVREAMEKETAIIQCLQEDINTLDEHSIDAIGVGYTYLLKKSGLYSPA